jgi:hypothetical protein
LDRNGVFRDNEESNINNEFPKKHMFLPSGNFMWEIKSKKDKKSYFIDSKREFCTCKGYYYNYYEKNGCYHLGKITECISKLSYKIYIYHDDYSNEFLKRIVLGVVFNV